jgi:hypothetical protein
MYVCVETAGTWSLENQEICKQAVNMDFGEIGDEYVKLIQLEYGRPLSDAEFSSCISKYVLLFRPTLS